MIVRFRPIGYLKMIDGGEHDEKIIGVPTDKVDPTYATIRDLKDLPEVERQRIEAFFRVYKDLPAGRNPVQLNGWGNAAEARALISEAMKRFESRSTPCVDSVQQRLDERFGLQAVAQYPGHRLYCCLVVFRADAAIIIVVVEVIAGIEVYRARCSQSRHQGRHIGGDLAGIQQAGTVMAEQYTAIVRSRMNGSALRSAITSQFDGQSLIRSPLTPCHR